MDDKRPNWFLFGAALSVNLLSFGTGTAFSWSSPVLPKLNGDEDPKNNPFGAPITPLQESWIASLISLGAAIGPFASGVSADKLGRKRTLLIFSLPMIASYIITAFATTVELFYLARILLGLGSGCVFSIVPMYLAEIAEDSNRGLLGCLMTVMLTTGTLSCYVVGPYTSIMTLSLTCIVPMLVFVVVFGLFIPESPYFHVLAGDRVKAEEALRQLRSGGGGIERELREITKSVEESKTKKGSLRQLVQSRSLRRGLSISIGLMFFQQFSGISVILGYMQSIFDATGSTIPSDISSIIIGSIQVVISFLTSQLVDRLGRKILLLVSTFGIAVSLGLLGTYFYFKNNGYDVDFFFWLPVTCLVVFISSYNFGIGPLAWTMMGELFPTEVKAVASTLTSFFCLMVSFLTIVFFPNVLIVFGIAVSFWTFSAVSAAGVVFVWLVVPETKGKSLQEIQNLLPGNKKTPL